MDQTFSALAERYLDEYPALSPVNATSLGDHRFDEQLDEVSGPAVLPKRNEGIFDRLRDIFG